jgi:hypothetical protein
MVGLKNTIPEQQDKLGSERTDLQQTTFSDYNTLSRNQIRPKNSCIMHLLISEKPMTVLIDVYYGVLLRVWAYMAVFSTYFLHILINMHHHISMSVRVAVPVGYLFPCRTWSQTGGPTITIAVWSVHRPNRKVHVSMLPSPRCK